MYIHSVISFLNAWEEINSKYSVTLNEILVGLSNFLNDNVSYSDETGRRFSRDVFEKAMYDLGWELNERTFYNTSGRKIQIRLIGPVKDGIAAQISMGSPDFLTRWLFTHTTLAIRHKVASFPILLVPMEDELNKDEMNKISRFNTFQRYSDQLEMLSPLSLGHPFLIIGYSRNKSLVEPLVYELPQDEMATNDNPASIVDRSIEFPPEYHQAGVGILNYFATYLNEEYPEEKATVRIEQSGLTVRMVVETDEGNKEVVEKALHEYELIVSGKESVDKFTDNQKLILELRNELRVAQFRLESQRDIIALQNIHLKKGEDQITSLLSLVGEGLRNSPERQISVQVNPSIHTSVAVEFNQDISIAIGNIDELIETLPNDSEAHLPLKDLEQALTSIENEKDPVKVRKSSAMSKYKRLIDQLHDGNSTLTKAIDLAEQGYDVAKELAKNYNKVAAWCGLPQVPEIFTKAT